MDVYLFGFVEGNEGFGGRGVIEDASHVTQVLERPPDIEAVNVSERLEGAQLNSLRYTRVGLLGLLVSRWDVCMYIYIYIYMYVRETLDLMKWTLRLDSILASTVLHKLI